MDMQFSEENDMFNVGASVWVKKNVNGKDKCYLKSFGLRKALDF